MLLKFRTKCLKEVFIALDFDDQNSVDFDILKHAITFVNDSSVSRYNFFDPKDVRALTRGMNKDFQKLNFHEFCALLTCNRNNCFENSSELELTKIVEKFLLYSNNIRRKRIIDQLGRGEYVQEDDTKTLNYFKSLFDVPYFQQDSETSYINSGSRALPPIRTKNSQELPRNVLTEKFQLPPDRKSSLSMPTISSQHLANAIQQDKNINERQRDKMSSNMYRHRLHDAISVLEKDKALRNHPDENSLMTSSSPHSIEKLYLEPPNPIYAPLSQDMQGRSKHTRKNPPRLLAPLLAPSDSKTDIRLHLRATKDAAEALNIGHYK